MVVIFFLGALLSLECYSSVSHLQSWDTQRPFPIEKWLHIWVEKFETTYQKNFYFQELSPSISIAQNIEEHIKRDLDGRAIKPEAVFHDVHNKDYPKVKAFFDLPGKTYLIYRGLYARVLDSSYNPLLLIEIRERVDRTETIHGVYYNYLVINTLNGKFEYYSTQED